MSKLQELIDRLCPNGVEFKPLGALSEETVTLDWSDNSTTNLKKGGIL
ncbi:MAG: hypothetical protein ACI35Y_06215 [Candidatus Limimorpha sp.]